MVSSTPLLVKEFKIYVLKSTIFFFSRIFLNVDNSFNNENRLRKFPAGIIDILIERTMSQIFYLGPSLCFMWLKIACLQFLEKVSSLLR